MEQGQIMACPLDFYKIVHSNIVPLCSFFGPLEDIYRFLEEYILHPFPAAEFFPLVRFHTRSQDAAHPATAQARQGRAAAAGAAPDRPTDRPTLAPGRGRR